MLIFRANVFLYGKYVPAKSLMSGVRCSLNIRGNSHICQMESIDGSDIALDCDTDILITTISGEMSLLLLKKGAEFVLLRGNEIGKGYVKAIEEVYLEKRYLEEIEDKNSIKAIVSYAELLPNALIYEDVYELLQ